MDSKDSIKSIKEICDNAYTDGEPLITDEEYDALFPDDESFVDDSKEVSRVPLPFWMGSLNKIRDDKKLHTWLSKNPCQVYCASEKIDGISGLLHEGKLFSRGNGTKGTDFSAALPYLNIPETDLSIRGELVMKNQIFLDKYADEYKNPRNLVAGAFGRKHLDENVLGDISFIAYEIVDDKIDLSPSNQMDYLKSEGFEIPQHQLFFNTVTLKDLSTCMDNCLERSEVAIDGIVVHPDDHYERNTSGNPSYAFAFKKDIAENIVSATITSVEWNVSKWGLYKPVVHIKPVSLLGVTIQKLTGFNAKFIKDNQVGEGAEILIKRSGDVIPHIVRVLASGKVLLPSAEWNGVDLKASTGEDDSTTIAIKTIASIFARLDVKFVSTATVEKMYNGGLNTLPKILTATLDQLAQIGLGQKTGERIVKNIHKVFFEEGVDLALLVGASGVLGYGIGSRRVETLFNAIPTFQTKKPALKTLIGCPGVSTVLANKISENHQYMVKFIKLMKTIKIRFNEPQEAEKEGQKYCLSGFRSKDISNVVDRVTKDCILIVKDLNEVSKKIDRARALNIQIISKNEYLTRRTNDK